MQISRVGTSTSNRGRNGASARAFTLVELIVVLIVLGISVGLVFPKLDGLLLREPEPWRSGRRLMRLIRYGRELAIATESTLAFCLDAKTGEYWVVGRQQGGESASSPTSSDLRGRLGTEVRMTSIELTGEGRDLEDILITEFSPEGWCDPMMVTLTSSEGKVVSIVIREWFDEIDLIGDNSAG